MGKFEFNTIVDNNIYKLPDKANLVLEREYCAIPDRLFGHEDFEGVQKLVREVIFKLNPDYKSQIMNNLIITGGTTSTKGFYERFQRELHEQLCNYKSRFFFLDRQTDRTISAWLTGSVIGSMSGFENLVMTRHEYQEHGLTIIDRKY